MTDRIVVRYFGGGLWDRFARVLTRTAAEHCPNWVLDIEELPRETDIYSPVGRQGNVHNTRKLDAWAAAVDAAADGDRVLLLDADTVILRPLDDVWAEPFDIAYTVKPKGSTYPFNGGVVFLRVADGTRRFLQQWKASNRCFLTQPHEHQVWLPPFGGINQSALGMLLSSNVAARPEPFRDYRHGLEIKRLSCLEWNCEDESWETFDPAITRIVHYKGALQRALTGKTPEGRITRPLVDLFKAEEARAMKIPERDRMVRPSDLTRPEDGLLIQAPEPPLVSPVIVPAPVASVAAVVPGAAAGPVARLTRSQRRAAARQKDGATG